MSDAGPGADERDPLAVLLERRRRQQVLDVAAMIGGDALQPADRDRLPVDASAPARRLARPVAGAPEDAREDVRLAVEHVGVGVAPLRDQPDVFGDVGVRRARPLAVDDLVVVVRVRATSVGCMSLHYRGFPTQGRAGSGS